MDINQLTASNIPWVSAFFLGLVASIGPCAMATNIAAVAYINRNVTSRSYAVITGSLYTLGRMVSYTILGAIIIVLGMEIPAVARFIQGMGEQVMGPLFIVIGLLMLCIDRFSLGGGSGWITALGTRVAKWGLLGGFLLGILFALAFCPYVAVLYFGALLPLALKTSGGIFLPAVFAIGTGLPVIIVGTLLSLGISGVSHLLNAISRAERVIRIIVAIIFIGVGIYYILQ